MSSLLAEKGKARPAMRRQNQPSQKGFGQAGSLGDNLGGGLGGFVTDEPTEDLGWNDMGDPDEVTPAPRAIGLTPFSGSPESLYVEGTDPDWDEADDEDAASFGGKTPQPVRPDAKAQWRDGPDAANPVGAMQDRIRKEATAPAPEPVVITKEVIKEVIREVEVPAAPPVNFLDRVSTAISRFFAAFTGKADRLLVLRLNESDCARLHSAAASENRDEGEIVAAAIEAYLSKQDPKKDQ